MAREDRGGGAKGVGRLVVTAPVAIRADTQHARQFRLCEHSIAMGVGALNNAFKQRSAEAEQASGTAPVQHHRDGFAVQQGQGPRRLAQRLSLSYPNRRFHLLDFPATACA